MKEGLTPENEGEAIVRFDQQYKEIKLPTMLLERLKKEFDENYEVSKRTSSQASEGLQPSVISMNGSD